jgi:hypothetical protein
VLKDAMATTERMSFLPMIKCSTCGTDIEISQLADHVCAPLSSSMSLGDFKVVKVQANCAAQKALNQTR